MTGTYDHRSCGKLLAQARRERDAARAELADVRERLLNLAAGLERSADATAPSKKSEVERGCAAAVRTIAEPPDQELTEEENENGRS